MSIRKLNFFTNNQDQYLAIMFYDNYVLIYDLNANKYCKLIGHRSFVANVAFDPQEQLIVSAGMDHRISLIRLSAIKETHWENVIQTAARTKIEDSDCPQL